MLATYKFFKYEKFVNLSEKRFFFTKLLSDDLASATEEILRRHSRDASRLRRHRFQRVLPTSLRQTGFCRRSNPATDRELG